MDSIRNQILSRKTYEFLESKAKVTLVESQAGNGQEEAK
jgi:hypothetical protein